MIGYSSAGSSKTSIAFSSLCLFSCLPELNSDEGKDFSFRGVKSNSAAPEVRLEYYVPRNVVSIEGSPRKLGCSEKCSLSLTTKRKADKDNRKSSQSPFYTSIASDKAKVVSRTQNMSETLAMLLF